jgi:hypothetical protein
MSESQSLAGSRGPGEHPAWSRAARCVGVGLFLTGIALGLLYYESRRDLMEDLRGRDYFVREPARRPPETLPDIFEIGRFMIALSCGSTGAGLTGYGCVLVLSRWRWFTG